MLVTASPAQLPAAEAKRLLTLYHYQVSQTVREPAFTAIVRLAARIYSLPISLLALVDAAEVLYKASDGQPEYWHEAREAAICNHVVQLGKQVIINDLSLASPRQLPATAQAAALQHGLRFYAGVPLHMPNWAVIGALCIIGHQPRKLNGQERQVLEQLAHLIEQLIIVRHASLSSQWGEEHWQFIQGYVIAALHQLDDALNDLLAAQTSPAPVAPAVLHTAVRHFNELASLLAEPLPEAA